MRSVLVIQHGWEDPAGHIGEILEEYGIEYDVIHVETEPIPDFTNYTALIGLGGSQHVYQEGQYPYLKQEKVQLRKAVEQDVPYLGICLGAQLLADVLNGPVRQHTMTEIGFFDVQITEEGLKDPLFIGLPKHQKVFHWHEDTFDLPTGAVLLASSTNTENQAFRYGKWAYGVQYHIELNAEILDIWLYHPESREDIVRVLGSKAYREIERERPQHMPIYQEHARIVCKNFLKLSGLIGHDM